MRKNIALLALEGEEMIEDQETTRVEPEEIQEMAEIDKDIETDQMVIEETEETSEAIGELAEKVEAQSGEEGEGISPETAEAVEVAVEHFCQRVGYSRKKINLATESFASDNRKQKSIQLAKDLRIAQEHLNKQLSIAQEGLWDKIKTKLDQTFTSAKKLRVQAVEAAKQLEQKGSKEGNIENKFLTSYLNLENKQELTGADAVQAISKLSKIIGNDKLIKLANEVDKLGNEVMTAMTKSNFIAKDEQVAKISELTGQLADIRRQAEELLKGAKAGAEVSIAPADAKIGKKVSEGVFDLLGKKDSDEVISKLLATWQKTNWTELSEMRLRLAGAWAADIRAADKAQTEIVQLYWMIADLHSMAFNVSHAAVRYIELSTAK